MQARFQAILNRPSGKIQSKIVRETTKIKGEQKIERKNVCTEITTRAGEEMEDLQENISLKGKKKKERKSKSIEMIE